MKAFLKENAVLVAGVALPLILTLVFFMVTRIEHSNIKAPEYKVAYTAPEQGRSYDHRYQVINKQGTLYLSFRNPQNKNARISHLSKPSLYIFDPVTNKSQIVELPEIDMDSDEEKIQVVIEDTKNMVFSRNPQSPDGYRFENSYRRNGNLMTELFGGGYKNRRSFVIRNGARSVKLPNANTYQSRFVGWVIPADESNSN